MIVLSDASPLISLCRIGWIEILARLYHEVIITTEVHAEVVAAGTGRPGAVEIAKAGWIKVRSVSQPAGLANARQQFSLGLGELSTIWLALELKADLVVIDELKARTLARQKGLMLAGCVGVLEEAFRQKLIADLAEPYRQLLASRAYVNRAICEASLRGFELPPLDAG